MIIQHKEDLFKRVESYPNKIILNTKSEILEKIDEQKVKFVESLFKQ
jgi:hypothetical protein